MKTSRIAITNFLAHTDLTLTFGKPVGVIHGPNGAGKSSIAEAIALALTGENPRAPLRKDYGALVHRGAKAGAIELDAGDDHYVVTIAANGTVTDSHKGKESPEALPYVLSPRRFADTKPDDRKDFLFRLLDLELSQDAKKARLIEKGCNEKKVDEIAPILLSGFPAAEKQASTRASEARGAWKAVTGENYGAVKAETWRAPNPPFSAENAAELHGLDKAIAELETDRADATKRLGIAEHEATQAKKRADTIEHLRTKAKTHAEHGRLVNAAAKELTRLKTELDEIQLKAGTKPPEWHSKLTCPLCQGSIMDSDDGESLVPWQDPPTVTHDPEAAARIPELQKAILTQQRVLERHEGNMNEADQAARQLKEQEDAAPAGKVEDPTIVRQTVETLQATIATKRKRQAELQDAQRKLNEADDKTKAARRHHTDVQDWIKIADALSPDGIPGELLAEALDPFNQRLAQSMADSGWFPKGTPKDVDLALCLHPDMSITLAGILYQYRSRAERYFIDAIIAEAISHFSGLRFLMCDDADVLVGESWEAFIRWADVLGNFDEADTVLIFVAADQAPPVQESQDSVALYAIEAPANQEQREAA